MPAGPPRRPVPRPVAVGRDHTTMRRGAAGALSIDGEDSRPAHWDVADRISNIHIYHIHMGMGQNPGT